MLVFIVGFFPVYKIQYNSWYNNLKILVSGIGDLRNDHDANCTYEGESNVLVQQTSNWLLKLWPMVLKGQKLQKTTLNSVSFLSDAMKILKMKFRANSVEEAINPESKFILCIVFSRSGTLLTTVK